MTAFVMRGVRFAGAGWALTQAVTFIAYFALARLIAPRDFGHFSAGILVAGVGTLIGDSGMASAVIQRRDKHDEVANTALVSTMLSGTAATLVALMAAPLVGLYFHSQEVGEIAAVMSGWLLLRMLAVVPSALMQRRFSFLRRVIVDPLAALAYLIAALVAGANDMGPWTLVIATYTGAVVMTAATWLLAGWRPHPSLATKQTWRELVRYGRPVAAAEFIRRAVEEIPIAGIGRFLGPGSLGQYTYATRVATQPLAAVIDGVTYVLLPSFASLASDTARLQAAFLRSFRAISTIAFPAGLMLAALGPSAMTVVFGRPWHQAGYALTALGLYCGARSLDELASELWKACGRVGLLPPMHVLSLVLTVVLVGAALPLGLVAVCAAVSLSAVGVACYAIWGVHEAIRVPIRSMLAELWPAAAAGGVMAVTIYAFDHLVVHIANHGIAVDLLLLAGITLLGLALYAAILRILAPATVTELSDLLGSQLGRLDPRHRPPA